MEKLKYVRVADIIPDEEQPRKYFDATKMASLKKSVKEHGIKTPLSVEDMGNGKYLLEDGERRFRVAKDLGLKEVPAVIEPLVPSIQRVVTQFNIQEQHEGWTPVEKAIAIQRIAKELKMSLESTLKLLSVPTGDQNRYSAFAKLISRDEFVKSEIPLDYVASIISLRRSVKLLTEDILEKEFTRSDEKALEKRVIQGIKDGTITKRGEVVRLKDSFTKNPKLIEKFMHNAKVTPSQLFIESKAKGAYHLRNAINSAQYFLSHGEEFLKLKDVKMTNLQLDILHRVVRTSKNLLDLVE